MLRKDTLQRHKVSSIHKEAEELESYRVASQCDEGIVSAFSSTVSSQRKALVGAMKLLYWLAKEEISITTKLSSLLDLSIQMGNDYLKELHLGGNEHYTSEQSISELLQSLSTSIEEDIVSSLKSSPYFALITDETTDISVLKQLVLVCRYSTSSGIKTSYFQITDIPNGTADTIETALLQALREKEIDISRLRGFGSDGAAVMVGSRNGVATKLKGHIPRIVSVHCINHRLALAAAHATDGIPYLQRFKSTLQSLFYFYQNSAVRMAGLHAIQEVLDQPTLKCKEAKDVRWLSHDMAIKSIIRTYPALLVSLDREASERGEPTARGLLVFVKSYKFLACAYLLSDILLHLSRLSRIFQKQNIDFSLIQPCLHNAIECISQYKDTIRA